jgi:hypothetical protein
VKILLHLAAGALLTLGLTPSPATATPPLEALDQTRADLVTELGFDPWIDPARAVRDKDFLQLLLRRARELHDCAAALRTEPTPPVDEKPFDFVTAFGFDPFTVDLDRLAQDRDFVVGLRNRLLEMLRQCPSDTWNETLDTQMCLNLCAISEGGCTMSCAEVGPPSPTCLDRCETRLFWCQVLCFLQTY